MALRDGFELGDVHEDVFMGDFSKHIPPERLTWAGRYVVRLLNHRHPDKDFATDYLAVVDDVRVRKRRFFMKRLGGAHVTLLPVTGEGTVLPHSEKRHIDQRGLGARVGLENLLGTWAHERLGLASAARILPEMRHGYVMEYDESHDNFDPRSLGEPEPYAPVSS